MLSGRSFPLKIISAAGSSIIFWTARRSGLAPYCGAVSLGAQLFSGSRSTLKRNIQRSDALRKLIKKILADLVELIFSQFIEQDGLINTV